MNKRYFSYRCNRLFTLILVTATWGSACSPEGLYKPAKVTDTASTRAMYEEVIQPIFEGSCTVCHGAGRKDYGIDLSSYKATMSGDKSGNPTVIPFRAQYSNVYRTIRGGFMPIGIPLLSEAEIEAVRTWIDAGAPGPDSEPVAAAVVPASFFNEKLEPVLRQNCVPCHGNARQDFGINLETYEGILSGDQYGYPVAVPYNRYNSAIYRSVLTPYMPPGPGMITDADAEIIGQWIDMGMPPPVPYLQRSSLPVAAIGVDYNFTLEATGGVAPYSFAVSEGALLPAGLSLLASGAVTGTPTGTAADEPFRFVVEISDSVGVVGWATASVKIFSVLPVELTFAGDIVPLIVNCRGCHNANEENGGWKVDENDVDASYAEMFEYGRIIRGTAQASPFYVKISSGSMARYFTGDIQVVADWIDYYNAQK